jgi:hypothetical protein
VVTPLYIGRRKDLDEMKAGWAGGVERLSSQKKAVSALLTKRLPLLRK